MSKLFDTALACAGPLRSVNSTGTNSFPCVNPILARHLMMPTSNGRPTHASAPATEFENQNTSPKYPMQNLVKLLVVLALAALGTVNSSQAASHTWTGAGANGFWSTTSNWSNGAPTAAEAAPVTLVFPYGMSPICTNNIPGLTVDSFMVL